MVSLSDFLIVAAILFEIARRSFSFFIISLSTYDLIYGTLVIIPTFLIWLYVFWSIVLYGILFVSIYAELHRPGQKNIHTKLSSSIKNWLKVIWYLGTRPDILYMPLFNSEMSTSTSLSA